MLMNLLKEARKSTVLYPSVRSKCMALVVRHVFMIPKAFPRVQRFTASLMIKGPNKSMAV